ncbi:glycoside hydrolase family 73 protein [Aerococcaceae bacterium WGS1372]
MSKIRTKKYKRKKKTTKRKPNKRSFKKTWETVLPKFLQTIGAMAIFFVIFIFLSGIVIFRWIDTANERVGDLMQQELSMEQRQDFLATVAPIAQRLQRQYGVLASVSMAQAALESDFGQSQLGSDYNNLYGVKTELTDPEGVDFPTLEFVDGEWVEIVDRFKVYPNWEASMESHAILIKQGTSWDPTFYQAVLDGDNYQEQANGLQDSGYATDPTYADKIISLIENYELDQYDQPMEN